MNVKSDHVIGEKISPSFSTNEKQIQNQSYHVHVMFSRALSKLQVIARNSDWFIALFAPVVIGRSNRPFPSCSRSLFQDESKCQVFVMNITSIHIEIRTNYNNKNFALRLALKERLNSEMVYRFGFGFLTPI